MWLSECVLLSIKESLSQWWDLSDHIYGIVNVSYDSVVLFTFIDRRRIIRIMLRPLVL